MITLLLMAQLMNPLTGDDWAIIYYVDHNPNPTNQLQDYQCGDLTYDLASVSYNHKGTDYYLWPFPWMQVNTGVPVYSISDGTITRKLDGYTDYDCTPSVTSYPNAFFIQHSNMTIKYFHFKQSSLISKGVGDTVSKGEFLGYVGKSGYSAWPHLHLEIEGTNGVVDPFGGPCSSGSLWDSQIPYKDTKVNAVYSHSSPPDFGCWDEESPNIKTCFTPGNVILAAYYSHTYDGHVITNTLTSPSGVVSSWNYTNNTELRITYRFWTRNLQEEGAWTYAANGKSCRILIMNQPVLNQDLTYNALPGVRYSLEMTDSLFRSWIPYTTNEWNRVYYRLKAE